jgi:hypothetical protein
MLALCLLSLNDVLALLLRLEYALKLAPHSLTLRQSAGTALIGKVGLLHLEPIGRGLEVLSTQLAIGLLEGVVTLGGAGVTPELIALLSLEVVVTESRLEGLTTEIAELVNKIARVDSFTLFRVGY